MRNETHGENIYKINGRKEIMMKNLLFNVFFVLTASISSAGGFFLGAGITSKE